MRGVPFSGCPGQRSISMTRQRCAKPTTTAIPKSHLQQLDSGTRTFSLGKRAGTKKKKGENIGEATVPPRTMMRGAASERQLAGALA